MGYRLDTLVIVLVGCDPELFITRDGQVVGSQELPTEGLWKNYDSKVVRDGVQVELNPHSRYCRQEAGATIANCMEILKELCRPGGHGIHLYPSTVEISDEIFAGLDASSRKLGCAPSLNCYEQRDLGVDPLTYRKRSLGGHIHLGMNVPHKRDPRQLAYFMDLLLGIPSVLLDRDPGAAERRLVYGRAGEYRVPSDQRFEYRTLSAYWLRDFILMHLLYGQARTAVRFWIDGVKYNHFTSDYSGDPGSAFTALAKSCDPAAVAQAINTNDFDSALKLWLEIKRVLAEFTQHTCDGVSAYNRNLDSIEQLAAVGLDAVFPLNRFVERWINYNSGQSGWESWSQYNLGDYLNRRKVG